MEYVSKDKVMKTYSIISSSKDKENYQKKIYSVLKKYWGYQSFRPWQEETIFSILEGQEALTVLPTGGGKSLCFQLPALLLEGVAIVISPLISLMKDQVDSLNDMGIAAACLNSSLLADERRSVIDRLKSRKIKLLYISPERLKYETTIQMLKSIPLSFFVIDEAHCISHWGHDFRESYRNLGMIKKTFPSIKVHAFTATATREVQQDILEQLGLENPKKHIASIDRPNLTYRVMPRIHMITQIKDILKKHTNEAGIIYCLRRDDVDGLSANLNALGYNNLPYHAGLDDNARHQHQDKFAQEKVDLIVATIAFGMGIDRSNIRFVIHAAMPKSMEHYQQETGRAGRDGLPSNCYMLYGGRDYRTWEFLLKKSPYYDVMKEKLSILYNFCAKPHCRHKVLANYFSQDYTKAGCDACDYCLGEVDMVENPLIIGQKILSCVYRVRSNNDPGFGASQIAGILKGNMTDKIVHWNHQELSTFGIMSNVSLSYIRYMVEQLIGQGFLQRDEEYSTLSLTQLGIRVLRGEVFPVLAKPMIATRKKEISQKRKTKKEKDWAGVDMDLFQLLREKRSSLAAKRKLPAYVIFGDKSLKDMAVIQPVTKDDFATVFGVGERKLKKYADVFIKVITDYIGRN
ncbi:MAG: DNA helicase RecQ [Candidatus Aureabacteria bacterium]|nr:DNA helicase RecQ [Candidatus Auribacterota bacterium]